MNMNTYNGPNSAHVRVKDVTATSNSFQIEESSCYDGPHTNEDIAWMVLETGSYDMPNNKLLQVQLYSGNHVWQQVTFPQVFGSNPIVLSQSQTFNGGQQESTRHKNIDIASATVRMQEDEGLDDVHMFENICVFSYGDKQTSKNRIDDVRIPQLDENVKTMTFDKPFTNFPLIFAQIQTFYGPDPAELRIYDVTLKSYKIFVEEENSKDDEVDHALEEIGVLALDVGDIKDVNGKIIGECGRINDWAQPDRTTWGSVTFRNSYESPVVFAITNTFNGPQPAHLRLKGVTKTGFQFMNEEFSYTDGAHAPEVVVWLVVNAGSYSMDNGKLLQAQTFQDDHQWFTYYFKDMYQGPPIVLSISQTYVGGQPIITRERGITGAYGNGRFQEEEGNDDVHMVETAGLISYGIPKTTKNRIEARIGQQFDENWVTVSYTQAFNPAPFVFVQAQTFNGPDTFSVRIKGVTTTGLSAFIEEEDSLDPEWDHTLETLGYFALDAGDISDVNGNAIGESIKFVSIGQPDRATWYKQVLKRTYKVPVVLCQMNTYNGPNAAHIRLQNVAGNSFQWQIEEWNSYDGPHASEDVACAVFESGSYLLPGNKRLTAQTYVGDHTWKTNTFSNAFTDVPVVMAQCQTRNGGQAVDTRITEVYKISVKTRLQEEEGNDGVHAMETIGVVSIGSS
jgi:hypothetical protein